MSANIRRDLQAHARVIPISEPNKIKTVTKMPDGSLQIEFNSGMTGNLSADDPQIQAFAVFTMIYEHEL